jgi:transcriptional antiterminator RfaH
VQCQHFKEAFVSVALDDYLELPTYLPKISHIVRGRVRHAPFFPGYLFVWADLQVVATSTINTIPGVVRLVAFDGLPQSIPAASIEALRQRVEQLNDSMPAATAMFQPGETVRLTKGPLRGLEALFVGSTTPNQRVRILISFLGGLRETEVELANLERVGAEVAPPQQRRTRGKGRRIKIATEI